MKEQEIQKQAKKIMDDFIKALDRIKEPKEFGIERENATRAAEKSRYGREFRDRMLANAPRKNDDFIIAEKKHW